MRWLFEHDSRNDRRIASFVPSATPEESHGSNSTALTCFTRSVNASMTIAEHTLFLSIPSWSKICIEIRVASIRAEELESSRKHVANASPIKYAAFSCSFFSFSWLTSVWNNTRFFFNDASRISARSIIARALRWHLAMISFDRDESDLTSGSRISMCFVNASKTERACIPASVSTNISRSVAILPPGEEMSFAARSRIDVAYFSKSNVT